MRYYSRSRVKDFTLLYVKWLSNVYLSIKLHSCVHYSPRDVHSIADKLNKARLFGYGLANSRFVYHSSVSIYHYALCIMLRGISKKFYCLYSALPSKFK